MSVLFVLVFSYGPQESGRVRTLIDNVHINNCRGTYFISVTIFMFSVCNLMIQDHDSILIIYEMKTGAELLINSK